MNNYMINYVKVLGILFLIFSLNACRSESSSADMVEKSKAQNDLSVTHSNHNYAKPGSAVSLKDSTPLFAPAPGVHNYRLSLVSPLNSGKMIVVASAGEGITISSSMTRFEFALENNGEYVLPLTVTAAREGRFYIQLHASVATEGQQTSRVIAAIVQVGEPSVVKQKASINGADTTSDGVIVLPAQETISPR